MIAYEAMYFAREAHAEQRRKYTGNPYVDHLAEVAGIASTVLSRHDVLIETGIAVAWLHDSMEDQGITYDELIKRFGRTVADGVAWLSDMEVGNRFERKAASRARLATAPSWVQTIKVADIISNTSSIVEHDPKFSVVYLEEKRLLLDMLTNADRSLVAIARELC